MSEALEKAKRNYEKNRRIKKTVSFNCETDRKRLNFTESINFSEWVKKKIDEAIAESEKLAKSNIGQRPEGGDPGLRQIL